MSERLILFSGGVESTAMLTMADPKRDVVLTVRDYGEPDPLFEELAVARICGNLGFSVNFAYMNCGTAREPSTFTYQLFALMAAASMWVSKRPEITEVWHGMHSGGPNANIKEAYYRTIHGWAVLHPKVHFYSPLDHETKAEQWARISDKIRPFVRNCLHGNACGACRKCIDLKALPGSFWSTQ